MSGCCDLCIDDWCCTCEGHADDCPAPTRPATEEKK